MQVSGENIRKFRELNNLTQSEIADFVGVSLRTIQNYESGNKIPNSKYEILHRLLNPRDKNMSEAVGDFMKDMNVSEPSHVYPTKSGSVIEELANGKYLLTVPMLPYKAQATYISEHQDADFVNDLKKVSFIVDRVPRGKYMAFEITNDSMNDATLDRPASRDAILDGDIVLGRELGKQHWSSKLNTNVYPYWIIVHKDTIVCKEIIHHDVEKGIITCHSLNSSPEFQDFKLNLDDCIQLFNIIKKQI